jgi:hypothetical protein
MLLLFFLAFLFFIFVSVIDGVFTVSAVQPYEWQNLIYWLWVMTALLCVSNVLFGVAAFLGDYGLHSREDYYALLILAIQPWILVPSGFLDIISRTVQEYLWLSPQLWLNPASEWPWLDPAATSGFPMLPYILSRLLGFEHTVTLGMFFGVAIGLMIVFALWIAYFYES